ncbi:hypothetical protein Afil01_42570 [Actinorhabdospora filicis]|uniref:Schlafen AlbA-2 domain-containing protein n=1 Tax=Actinorhabdospora filicis TaxID=1785913 RepID=A0A9W6SM38_9ACTN|nr:ATP-binding protein [Actinorhabdospora filicis]GLZ79450.1 hypothetical protein Afil01_42570 [Actinorhabdospora filicis]
MTEDLADLLGTQETIALEFKRESQKTKRDDIRKAICAMANDLGRRGGGDILIGVNDDGTPVEGTDTSDAMLLAFSNMRNEGKILDVPTIQVSAAPYRGKPVIRIRVEASRTPPVRFDNIVYVRSGPSTRKAVADEERILSERRIHFHQPFDSHPVLGSTVEELDLGLFRHDYLPATVDRSVLEENGRPIPQQLAAARMTDADGVPTVLGHLVLGFDPRNRIPGAYVQFIRYLSKDVTGDIGDDQELRYNITDLERPLSALLRAHNRKSIHPTGDLREETRPDYPIEALREACMNAIMHRNYESSNAAVRISWFDDRIEISNPGGPYGQVRPDNFTRTNDYRNPSLAAAMKSLGYVNRFGRGISRIIETMNRNGNPEPEFVVDATSWLVIMRRSQ